MLKGIIHTCSWFDPFFAKEAHFMHLNHGFVWGIQNMHDRSIPDVQQLEVCLNTAVNVVT